MAFYDQASTTLYQLFRYINCFETLAQLALMQTCVALIPTQKYSFRLPTGSDNTGATAGLNSLFSTCWPISCFLDWAHAKKYCLRSKPHPRREK